MIKALELADWRTWWRRRGAAGIRRLLLEEWDPYSIQHVASVDDEYDSYVFKLGRMLREGATARDVTLLLNEESRALGDWPSTRERDQAVADRLVAWYAKEMEAT